MNGQPQTSSHPLTQDDAHWLIDQLYHVCPGVGCSLDRMEAAGLPNPVAKEQFESLKRIMLGLLQEYFPDHLVGR